MESEKEESLNSPEVENIDLSGVLSSLKRRSLIKGMEGYLSSDPVAQEILQAGQQNLEAVESFLKSIGISGVVSLPDKYGLSAVVLDAGEKVVRLSKVPPTLKPEVPFVLQPEASEKIGDVYVQVSEKVEMEGIVEEDVQGVKKGLAAQGYEWDDAGTDNLGRDKNGKLVIIDGSVRRKN